MISSILFKSNFNTLDFPTWNLARGCFSNLEKINDINITLTALILRLKLVSKWNDLASSLYSNVSYKLFSMVVAQILRLT